MLLLPCFPATLAKLIPFVVVEGVEFTGTEVFPSSRDGATEGAVVAGGEEVAVWFDVFDEGELLLFDINEWR